MSAKDAASFGFQGSFSEEVEDFDLNYNEFDLRTYDPQIGRWTTPDPYDEFASPYRGMGDNPVNLVDPSGANVFASISNVFIKGISCPTNAVIAVSNTFSTAATIACVTGTTLAVGANIFINQIANTIDPGPGEPTGKLAEVKILSEVTVFACLTLEQSAKLRAKKEAAEAARRKELRERLLEDLEQAVQIDEMVKDGLWDKNLSEEEAKMNTLSLGINSVLPEVLIKPLTIATNIQKILSKAERLEIFKTKILKAPIPKNPEEALNLVNKTLDEVEDAYSGVVKNVTEAAKGKNDGRMYGILDEKYVTHHADGGITALTKGHRIEIAPDGSLSIFDIKGNLFLSK